MASDGDIALEQFKAKRLIKMLDAAKGNGTSAITLVLRPKQDINMINKMLTEEYLGGPLGDLLILFGRRAFLEKSQMCENGFPRSALGGKFQVRCLKVDIFAKRQLPHALQGAARPWGHGAMGLWDPKIDQTLTKSSKGMFPKSWDGEKTSLRDSPRQLQALKNKQNM